MADSLPTPLRLPYKTTNTLQIPTDIYIPPSPTVNRSKCPVLLMLHGGGFIVGHAGMNSKLQISDCLSRGWIVCALEHRLCPGVTLKEGPVEDARDALAWVREGGLALALDMNDVSVAVDEERVLAMGTSSGGCLALNLGWGVPKPPVAILDFYGVKNFRDPFWRQPVKEIAAKMPLQPAEEGFFDHLFEEKEVLKGGASLEGQAGQPSRPDFSNPRQHFVIKLIAEGRMMQTVQPDEDWQTVDPILNLHERFPPTCIVHGAEDFMMPPYLSREMYERMRERGLRVEYVEVEGEGHTFAGQMVKESKTWETQRRGFDFLEAILRESYGD